MTPVQLLELVLVLLAAALLVSRIAARFALPPAAALLIGGMVLALVPGMPAVDLDPDLILILFLPPLLFAAAFATVWRDFVADLRPILLLAIGAVTFTTFGVGAVTHLVMPSLPWAACFTLGAIVSPPDAVAAKVVLEQLKLPRRILTILEGESLINDASSLLLYRFAVAAALTGSFSYGQAAATFVWLTIAGVALGAAIAWMSERILRRLEGSAPVTVLSFLTAYASYIAAEQLHASGVLAVVACGLVMGGRQSSFLDAHSRTETRTVWDVVVFILEALVFVLIGLSLRGVLTRLGGDAAALWNTLPLILAVNGAVVALRFLWVFPAAYALDLNAFRRRARKAFPPPSVPFVISWAGMRGVVSLAPALALPTAFSGRDTVLLAAFTVILVTVLVQGTTLGAVIHLTGLSRVAEPSDQTLDEAATRMLLAEAALRALEDSARNAEDDTGHRPVIDDYRGRLAMLARWVDTPEAVLDKRRTRYEAALAAIAHERAELNRLHRSGQLHESVKREVERDLDLEEVLLHRSLRR